MKHHITKWATTFFYNPQHLQVSHCIPKWATKFPSNPPHSWMSHHIPTCATTSPKERPCHLEPLNPIWATKFSRRQHTPNKPPCSSDEPLPPQWPTTSPMTHHLPDDPQHPWWAVLWIRIRIGSISAALWIWMCIHNMDPDPHISVNIRSNLCCGSKMIYSGSGNNF